MAEYQRQVERIWQWLLRHRWLALAFILFDVGIQIFAEIAENLWSGELAFFDQCAFNIFHHFQTPALYWLAIVLSWLLVRPNVLVLILPCIVYLLITHRYRVTLGYLAIIAVTAVLVEGLKTIFSRPRPTGSAIIVQGFSFPSGHAMGGMVIYGLLAYLLCRYIIFSRWARVATCIITAIVILFTGESRIYLGVHYPSDVLAGWSAGVSVLFGSIIFLEGLQHRWPSNDKSN